MVRSKRPPTKDLCLDVFLDGVFAHGEAFQSRTMFESSLDAALVSDTEEKPLVLSDHSPIRLQR